MHFLPIYEGKVCAHHYLPDSKVCLAIDYEKYVAADIAGKKKLTIDNILASVKSVSKRGKININ